MSRIAFFSDDEAGVLCARLACLGMTALPGSVTLGLPGEFVAACPPGAAPVSVSVVARPPDRDDLAAGRPRRSAFDTDESLVVALPLEAARDGGVRARFDVAVAVGGGEAAAARALRMARYVASDTTVDAVAPAWFLPCSGQSELRAKAMLSASGRLALPFATRALPMALPRLTMAARHGLATWEPGAAVMGTGLLLAALVLCVGAEPGARRLEPSDIAERIAGRASAAERALSDRLATLANAYGRLEGSAGGSVPIVGPARRRASHVRPDASAARRRDEVVRASPRLYRA